MMRELTVPWLPFGVQAIMLWPLVLYLPSVRHDPCVRAHEKTHWDEAVRWGVLLWYAVYLTLLPFWWGARNPMHPMEVPAYAAQRLCDAAKRGR
jgi:hypothetical protein